MAPVVFVIALSLLAVGLSQQAPTPWPDCYRVRAILRLPYAELEEPFTAYYEAKKNRSRIDYFDVMKTYQIGPTTSDSRNYSLKIVPMTTDNVLNKISCFQVNGTADSPVTPQIVFPDVTQFNMTGKQTLNGIDCYVWQLREKIGSKVNAYTVWQSVATRLPVRYEMMGYDTLLGSHYDKYFIDYKDVSLCSSLSEDVFTVPKNLTCGNFPGPGNAGDHRIHMNPLHEFIHHDESHLHKLFDDFKKTYNRNYVNELEHEQRKHIFRHNLRFVNSKNRAPLTYKLRLNHFADLTEDEMKVRRGFRRSTLGYNGGLPFNKADYEHVWLPDQLDWRVLGAVTQVKDQAVCGSCWSFGTVGAVEGAYFLKTGQLERFSQQELIDCSWGELNNGCDGGEDFRSYEFIRKHGLATEDAYGPYMAVDGYCKMKSVNSTVQITGFVNVTSGDAEALKLALYSHGPISVAIDASHRSLSFYAYGVYYEPDCSSEDLDHAVLAVGYGTLNGQAYWLVKNSWSTYWGNDGYVLMSQKNNNCGVTTSPTYVLM
jgi:hypothetical protein